ncbi:MAG: Uma2 family endonuclease [Microcoleaceae cyanobacterium]
MIVNINNPYLSPEDYLAGEKISSIKHEYRNGFIHAMAGASNPHVLISLNLATLLRNHLRGTGCLPFMSDTKVRIETANAYYYPDIVVSCNQQDTNSLEDFICFPQLIIEVLSPTTEAFDRGDKFADYRTLESLKEYILIRQDRISIECYRINSEGYWVLYPYHKEQEFELTSIDFRCSIASVYEDVLGIS